MGLTAEQQRVMEENRRKALERRAAKQNEASNQTLQNHNSRNCVPSSNKILNPPIVTLTPVVHRSLPAAGVHQKPGGTPSQHKGLASKQLSSANRQSVVFQLTSRFKFTVEAPFDNEMVEIFKKIPSKAYDGSNRKWTFALADHQKLVDGLNPLLAKYQIQPLPRYVMDIFRTASVDRVIPEVDLSCIDSKLSNALLPFQRAAVYFGVFLNGRVLIADDMGLGKTLQALAIAHYYLSDWPLLILTPSSMKFAWEEAVRVWLPSVPLHHMQIVASGKDFIDKDLAVTICSYDLLTRRLKDLEAMKFKTIIFDESHLIKSRNSHRGKAAHAVSKNSRRVLLLSGTPALSRPEELFSQLQIVDPKPFTGNFHNFGLRYCGAKETNFGWNYGGATNMTELQLVLEEKYMIRRLKSQVLSQLPSKQRQMIILDPSLVKCNTSAMKSMASSMNQDFARAIEKRGALLSYYSESAKAKSKAVCDYIEDLVDGGKKFLCFAHHSSLIEDLCQCIQKKSVDYIKIDGSVNAEERKRLCDNFQLKENVRVAVLSITAANAGLTLTSANLVVFAELFWNPGILTQAEDRAHRIGQQDSVVVQYLVAKGTADDYLWPLVQSKLDILSKAGLSKDNFHEADTTQLTSSKQRSIIDCFEELSKGDLEGIQKIEAEEFEISEPDSKRTRLS